MTLLWSITIDDIIAGLRESGLQHDPTRRELDLICQYTDSALDEAVCKLLEVLAARITPPPEHLSRVDQPRVLAALRVEQGHQQHKQAQQFQRLIWPHISSNHEDCHKKREESEFALSIERSGLSRSWAFWQIASGIG